ncbi:oxidoreductase [Lacinutrix undariae]
MRLLIIFLLSTILVSCNSEIKTKTISQVEINPLLKDSTLNVRAFEIDDKGLGAFATSQGKIGGVARSLIDEEARLTFQLKEDTIIPNFRALAVTKKAGFILSIGSPALLYKIGDDSLKIVYRENHEKVFYDAMDFWNDREGIAIGDPTDNCLSIIITRDAGETWEKLSCNVLPNIKEGEAAFAASDTNIAIVGDKTWVATGGKASRVLFSPDKGKTWTVFETPIVQGLETTGIYSLDFYDEENGFAIGGDYTKPEATLNNKIRTKDGGKTWKVVANNKGPGYRSCVQYVPNSNAKKLVAVGFKGIDCSNDAGNTWQHLSDEGFYTIRFLNDSTAYAGGNGSISKLIFK